MDAADMTSRDLRAFDDPSKDMMNATCNGEELS